MIGKDADMVRHPQRHQSAALSGHTTVLIKRTREKQHVRDRDTIKNTELPTLGPTCTSSGEGSSQHFQE